MSALVDEAVDQLANLDHHCDSFFGGTYTLYKSISVTLRTLLRGSSGDVPLAKQVIPDPCLFQLRVEPDNTAPPDYLVLPAWARVMGSVKITEGCKVKNLTVDAGSVENLSIGEMFDDTKPPLSLDEWLCQPFLRAEWTLDDFIRTVAHKDGGAHVDPNNDQLQAMQAWGHFHWHLMAGIGRSVHAQLVTQLERAHPRHQRVMP